MSASIEKQIESLLKTNRFRLVRQSKHRVWRNPEGKVFVASTTPSDWRAAKKQLSTLKKVLASDPTPEVVAISEFERLEALTKIHAQEKKVSGASQAAKTSGTGYVYIDKKKEEIVSTRSPEEKRAEREQRQWESLVRRTRQEFVANVVAKHKALLPKLQQELTRRYREYADKQLERELRSYDRGPDPVIPLHKCSRVLRCIFSILDNHSGRIHKILGEDFNDRIKRCQQCIETEESLIRPCFQHNVERFRVIALNAEQFTRLATAEEVTSYMGKLFNASMRCNLDELVDPEGGGLPILGHYAWKKARELTGQLLATRPKREAA